jgi:hypothetical protein
MYETTIQTDTFLSSLYDTALAAGNVVDAVKSIVKELVAAVIKAAALKAIMSAFGMGGAGGGAGILGKIPIIGGLFQGGGMVPGRGPVPIMAHGGEAVLTREAVQRFGGPQVIERINTGSSPTSIDKVELSFPGITDTASLRRELPGIVKDLRRKGRL